MDIRLRSSNKHECPKNILILADGKAYRPNYVDSRSSIVDGDQEFMICLRPSDPFEVSNIIKNVIFHDPATIVFWADGSKTVVKTTEGEGFDPEKGLAMAITNKFFSNDIMYHKTMHKYIDQYKKQQAEAECNNDRYISHIMMAAAKGIVNLNFGMNGLCAAMKKNDNTDKSYADIDKVREDVETLYKDDEACDEESEKE